MTAKLDILEARVRETVAGAHAAVAEIVATVQDTVDTTVAVVQQGVAGAQSTVEEIVTTVQDTVGETIDTVKRTVDVPYQVDRHPWLLVGGATVVGYLLGSWRSGRTSPACSTPDAASSAAGTTAAMSAALAPHDGLPPAEPASSMPPPVPPGLGSRLREQVQEEVAMITVAAVEALICTLREMVKQAVPALAPHLERARRQRGGQSRGSPPQQPAPLPRAGGNGRTI
jgi:ElaB/YqjD/DUF883 family membrane-anchored ribosome-binding protein